jgi:hypothetical protein
MVIGVGVEMVIGVGGEWRLKWISQILLSLQMWRYAGEIAGFTQIPYTSICWCATGAQDASG